MPRRRGAPKLGFLRPAGQGPSTEKSEGGLGLRVEGLGFRRGGLGFRVWEGGFRGFRV